MKRLLLVFAFSVASLRAAILPSDGTPTDVAAKITAALPGDTVTIPAGYFTWSSGVTVSGKAISIQGAGSGRIITRSTTTATIGLGAQTFTVTDSGLSITPGQTLRIERTGNIGNWMQGTVTSYSGTTLVMNITSTGGSGAQILWIVSTVPSTTIVNNAGASDLFALHADTAGVVQISGIQFVTGTGSGRNVDLIYNASAKDLVVHDCWFRSTNTSGDMVFTNTNQGLIYNCSFDSSPFSEAPSGVHMKGAPVSSWTTPSTMGSADTTGFNNFYVEDCDFHAWLNAADTDDNFRSVWRHNLMNNAGVGSHGADSSTYGARHWEYYSNTCVFNGYSNGQTFNMNWWFFIRGGTGVITGNVMPHIQSQDYGNKGDLNIIIEQLGRNAGPNGGWGVINTSGRSGGWNYPAPRQPGFGYVTGTQIFPAWVSGASYPGPGANWSGNYVTYAGHTYKSTVANSSTTTPDVNTAQWTNTGFLSGNDSATYIGDSEPIYVWNNSGAPDLITTNYGQNGAQSVSTTAVPIQCDFVSNYVVLGRDYFFDQTNNPANGAKPGWTPYTYPHPLRGATVGPVITLDPVSQSVAAGTTVTFTANASGSPTPTWQWSKGASPIGGATSSIYVITNAVSGDAGSYSATATNSSGSATSATATLTVTAAPPPAGGVPGTPVITGVSP